MKLCPKCKSKEIVLDAGIITGQYYCKKCGYCGSLIIEKFNASEEQK